MGGRSERVMGITSGQIAPCWSNIATLKRSARWAMNWLHLISLDRMRPSGRSTLNLNFGCAAHFSSKHEP